MNQRFFEGLSAYSKFRLLLLRVKGKSLFGNPIFRHLPTGLLWERYEFDKVEHMRITGYGYREYPIPELKELIEIAVDSDVKDEIVGASRLLYALEWKGIEFREKLLERMDASVDSISRSKFEYIYEHANLGNLGNLREIMFKSSQEVTADHEYYKELYRRAERIRERVYAKTSSFDNK